MDLFNNRELAILILAVGFFSYGVTKESLRSALAALVRAAVAPQLVKSYGAMALYVSVVLYALSAIGLWDVSQLKPTIIWAFSIALISALRANKIFDDPGYFKRSVRDNLKLIIVLEFVLGFYTFPLWGELVLVPVSTFLGVMTVFVEGRDEHRSVKQLLDTLLFVLGVFVLGFAGYKLWVGFDEFATVQTFREFYTPPLLSLLFLPFLFGLSVLMAYERVFLTLRRNLSDEATFQYARRQAVKRFAWRVRKLQRWANSTHFQHLTSKDKVDESISAFQELVAYEANPRDVPPEQGWAPHLAKDFMNDYGMKTGYYNRLYDDEWSASSNYLNLDDGVLPNCVFYSISGNQFAAECLKLRLTVNEPEHGEAASERFVALSEALLAKALSADVSTNLADVIRSGQSGETEVAGRIVSIHRENWHVGQEGRYEVTVKVTVTSATQEMEGYLGSE